MILSVPPRFGVGDKDGTIIVVCRWKDKMFKHKQHNTVIVVILKLYMYTRHFKGALSSYSTLKQYFLSPFYDLLAYNGENGTPEEGAKWATKVVVLYQASWDSVNGRGAILPVRES